MFKICLVASTAYYGAQVMTGPHGHAVKENVVVIEKCVARPDVMNNVFYERAWRRVQKLRAWSRLG